MSQQTFPDSQTYDYVFRSTSDGIIACSPAGLIEQINPAAAGMLSVTTETVIGSKPKRVFSQHPALLNLFHRSGDQALDVRLPRRRLAAGIASTLESGVRLVILHDVTEQRDLENRREALVRAIAHDLRNPISAINGFVDLIDRFGELNEQQNRFLGRTRETVTKLHDVAGQLVDLAWIEAGMPLEHRPIQMRTIINNVVKRVSPLAHDYKIVIAVSVQNPMPMVMGDPERLEQAVYNLLHNAVIFSEPDQSVVIHGWGDTDDVYCSVADRGIGIPDDELEMIFDRMYRSRAEYVRNVPGNGLGLTIAKTIIQRHGGDIWASSNLGEGSTFTFLLPTVEL